MPFMTTATADLLVCHACGGRRVCPLAFEICGSWDWLIRLRCGDCGHRADIVASNAATAIVEVALARDLIDAGDFARPS
jgi:hypothetical protein